MAVHTLTPARRAALRKAQLASARKRRKGGVGTAAKRSVTQHAQYASASFKVRNAKKKGSFKAKAKKGAKYTAIGVGGAFALAAGAGAVAGHNAGKREGGGSKKTTAKYTAAGAMAGGRALHQAAGSDKVKRRVTQSAKNAKHRATPKRKR